jgi:hypothetical protein
MKMPTSKGQPISRATRTTAQELERQRQDAERDLAARKNLKPLTTARFEEQLVFPRRERFERV